MRAFFAVWGALALVAMSVECMRTLQATGYKPRRGYIKVVFSRYYLALLCVSAVSVVLHYTNIPLVWICVLYSVVATVLCFVPRKTPLKITKRMVRMLGAEFLLLVAFCLLTLVAVPVLLSMFVWLAWLLCLPIEEAINKKYLIAARNKLEKSNLVVIAITGSYGKTSTKEMLAVLLQGSIAPSGSCNTPLGIAKFINSADFSAAKYLVLEFGARQRGDIAELCAWFRPKYGIVTGVCEQHISTFKTLENIKAAKSELVNMLPRDGVCILCDQSVQEFANVGVCKKVMSPSVSLDHVTVTPSGIDFSMGGRMVHLPQITEYSAKTFAFCATMCQILGQSLDVTVSLSKFVAQVPHRMEISYNGKFYIIDDSYNASISGVKACCGVLAKFDGMKVAISQGIVECGARRKQLNVLCGELLGKVCNVVVVLGRNKRELFCGARRFCERVFVAKSLQDAVEVAQQHILSNGFLLFQNDLPDSVNI